MSLEELRRAMTSLAMFERSRQGTGFPTSNKT
jgi:hypothetical protein